MYTTGGWGLGEEEGTLHGTSVTGIEDDEAVGESSVFDYTDVVMSFRYEG
jgi:hypothetical protein